MSAPDFSTRSTGMEIMDDLNCSGEVVHQTLRELEFINRTLGGNAVTVNGVKELLRNSHLSPIHILDLGCGGGDMVKLLKRQIKTAATFKGVDANPHIVRYAEERNTDSQVSFAVENVLSDTFKEETCDVAVATLFLHHFTNDQLVDFLTGLKEQAKVGVVINDLHRHPLAYYSIKILTRLLSKSSMVKYDAPLSVLRGFTRNEWRFILEKAGTKQYSLKWKWAFRWQIIIRNQAIA